jgi:mannosyltransferase
VRRGNAIALASIVAAGAAVRFATLPARSYWIDEGATVIVLRRSFGSMLSAVVDREGAPPVYYVLAWLWTRAFGLGEAGLRSLSALLGTAAILVAYGVGRRLVSGRAGLATAAVAAVSPFLVWVSQDGRTYVLAVLLGGLSLLTMLRALEAPSRFALAAWALASSLAMATHYFAVFLVAAEAVWLLREHPDARRVRAALAAPLLTGAALIPLAVAQSGRGGAFIHGSDSLARRVAEIPAQFLVGFQPPAEILLSAAAALAVLAALWLLATQGSDRERRGATLAGGIGAVAIGIPLLAGIVPRLDYVLTRNMAAAWIPLAAVVGAGLGARRAGILGAAALAGLCGLSLAVDVVTARHSKFDHEDWRGAAHAMGTARVGRAVVVTPLRGARVLPIYLRGARILAGRVAVAEIDVVGLPPPYRRVGVTPRPPRPASPAPPPGFALAQRREARTFTLLRYRAPRPTEVGPAAMARLAFDPAPPSLLVQPTAR